MTEAYQKSTSKGLKRYFFVLIIYILFSNIGNGQELYLQIQAEDSVKNAVIDSLSYQQKHANLKTLLREIDTVFYRVQKIGFLDARVFKPQKENDSLYKSIFVLGKQYQYIYIQFDSLPLTEKVQKQLGISAENKFLKVPIEKVEGFLDFINKEVSNRGRPFSFVQLQNLRKGEKASVWADLEISSSKKRYIDKIVIKGYEKFPQGFLKHFVGIKKGQEFNKKVLDKKVERLENIRFASSLRSPEVQFTKDSTAVYLYLDKRKSNSFDGFLGFSNEEENSRLKITGHVDVVLLNNLNFGESLQLEYKSDGNEQTRFRADVDLPFLFQTPFGLQLGLDIFKKDSTFTTVEQRARLKYQFNEKFNAFVGYRHSESNNLLEESEQIVGSLIEDFTAQFTSLGGQYLIYNSYDDLFPVKTSLNLELGYGNRERFREKTTQWWIVSDLSHIFELNRRNAIFVRNLSSVLSSDNYLTNELFRFGGINSLRGFEENSIAASLFSSTQTEYRFLLAGNLYVHSIIDYAYFENDAFGFRENLYGVGFGLGLQTGAGLLKVNFANGKADGQDFEFVNTKIHLSLTTTF